MKAVTVHISELSLDSSKLYSLGEILSFESMVDLDTIHPILVDKNNRVVDGNKRVLIALKNGLTKLSVIRQSDFYPLSLNAEWPTTLKKCA